MKKEKSCGGIVFRINQGNLEFLLVQSKKRGHRFFPKGHVEAGETEEETALREIFEEVGLQVCLLPGFRETFSYVIDSSIEKTVVFFVGEYAGGSLIVSDELLDAVWLDYKQSLSLLIHDNSKGVLTNAYNFLLSLS